MKIFVDIFGVDSKLVYFWGNSIVFSNSAICLNFKYLWVYAGNFCFVGGGGGASGVNGKFYGHTYLSRKERVPPCAGK